MAHFYPANPGPYTGPNVDVWRMDGTRAYLEHYGNRMILDFFAKHGTFAEQRDVEREIAVCERKLAFWRRHPNFDQAKALEGIERIKRNWKGKP